MGEGSAEEVLQGEAIGLEDRPALVVEPGVARAVVVQLDAVAVGVVQVDRDRAAVVGGVVRLDAVVEQALDGLAQFAAVGVDEGDVVQAGVAGRGRGRARALPRVEADVVVVVAGGEEGGFQADRRPSAVRFRPSASR